MKGCDRLGCDSYIAYPLSRATVTVPTRRDAAGAAAPETETRPKYRMIQERIRLGIANGSLAPAGKLPSEHDLASMFGVAYMTVRTAINGLADQGLLHRIHGKGTFVAGPVPESTSAGMLAIVVPSLASLWNVPGIYYFPSIIQGFCAEATRLGYEPTMIGREGDSFSTTSGVFHNLAGAACVMVCREDSRALETLRDAGVPVVGVNRYHGRRAISYVVADQAGGVAAALGYLLDLGHRRIAFLEGPRGNLGADERRAGFITARTECSLEPVDAGSWPGDYTDVSGMLRTEELLSRKLRPTAIVTAGDLIAAGAMKAARQAGIRVPDDLSIIGYGDFEIATHLRPALTTVRLPLAELGAQAVLMLHEQISGVPRQKPVMLHTSLVERESVGPARGGDLQ